MLKQKTKVIEAGGAKYRLGKMDARSASYLAMKAAAVIAPALSNVKGMNKQDAITSLPMRGAWIEITNSAHTGTPCR